MASESFDRFLLSRQRRRAYERAKANESAAERRAIEETARQMRETIKKLKGDSPYPIGRLEGSDTIVESALFPLLQSGFWIGGSGSGKSRFLLLFLHFLFDRFLENPAYGVEIQLIDPKTETFVLTGQLLAALWLRSTDEQKDRLVRAVRVIDYRQDRVTPFTPYLKTDPAISVAYFAKLRSDVKALAGSQAYTGAMFPPLLRLSQLLIEKSMPLNYRFVEKLFLDEKYRAKVVRTIVDPDVRHYFDSFEHVTTTLVIQGLLRRLLEDTSFPETKCALGIPPEDVKRLLPSDRILFTIGNYGPTGLPPALILEQGAQHIADAMLAVPRRDTTYPKILIFEELPVFFSGATALGPVIDQILSSALRTVRSQRVGLHFVSQGFFGPLPRALAEALALNARWLALFRSGAEDAELVAAQALPVDPAHPPRNRVEHLRQVTDRIENLPPRHFTFLVRGSGAALPLVSLDAPDLAKLGGVESDYLLTEIFEREFAARSMVSTVEASRLIADWEHRVVGKGEIPPSPDGLPIEAKDAEESSRLEDFLAELDRRGETKP